MSKVSDCCGASPAPIYDRHGGVDCSTEEFGLCPECKDHCEYVEEEETENIKEENNENRIQKD